jgi:hypothetical protein
MPAPAIVQTSINSGNGATTLSITFTVSANNAILVIATWLNATSSINLPSDGHNTYKQVGSTLQAQTASQACYTAANITAGSTTVTVSSVGATALPFFEIQVSEISGADPITPAESFTAASGNSAAPLTPTHATTHSTSLLIAFCTTYANTNAINTNTFQYVSGSPANFGYAMAFDVQKVKGNYSCLFGTDASNHWIAGLVVIGQPGTAVNGPFMVQNATNSGYTGTSGTVVFTNGITSGNLVFLALFGGGVTTTSVSDGTNTYKQIGSTINPGGGVRSLELFYASNVVGGATTLTISNGTFDNVSIIAAEYQYIHNDRDPFDVQANNNGNSTSLSSGSVTTNANDLQLTILNSVGGGIGYTLTDGSTEVQNLASTSFVVGHTSVTSGTSIVASATANTGAWIAQVVSFKIQAFTGPLLPTDSIFFGMT